MFNFPLQLPHSAMYQCINAMESIADMSRIDVKQKDKKLKIFYLLNDTEYICTNFDKNILFCK